MKISGCIKNAGIRVAPNSELLDEFLCLPNHVHQMKYWYNQLLIETYKSNWWIAVANKLTGEDYSSLWSEPKQEIITQIASAQYAIN